MKPALSKKMKEQTMDLYEIKQRILNLKDIEFNRFENWFDKTVKDFPEGGF